jgi:hypothetical protein
MNDEVLKSRAEWHKMIYEDSLKDMRMDINVLHVNIYTRHGVLEVKDPSIIEAIEAVLQTKIDNFQKIIDG